MTPRAHPAPPRQQPTRQGFAAMYTAIALVALCGLVSLGVDVGRIHLAKSELQTAADAAARAAAFMLPAGVQAARAEAADVAVANTCDGTPILLDTVADVEFGTWDPAARSFVPVAGAAANSANALRITARRIAARDNALPLTFARIVGKETCDVSASAIAYVIRGGSAGFVGLDGITLKNKAYFASYHSSFNTDPTRASASDNGSVGSNGVIQVQNVGEVRGDVQLGPSASISGSLLVSGSTSTLSSGIPAPAQSAWSPSINPAGVSQDYTVTTPTTLPGGTYWLTSLAIEADLSFSGPATLYVNGDIIIDADLLAHDAIPANLKIHQLGSARTFGDDKANHISITADVEAPGADLLFKNKLTFRGRGIFGSIETKNSAEFFYDEAAGAANGRVVVSLVK